MMRYCGWLVDWVLDCLPACLLAIQDAKVVCADVDVDVSTVQAVSVVVVLNGYGSSGLQ